MKIQNILLALALGASTCVLTAQDDNPQGGPPRGRAGFHVLPPGAKEKLNLTADQQKQVAALEAEVKAKLEKILTPDQLSQLKQMRPPRRQGGQGGPEGGPEGGPQGGPGGPRDGQQ